MRDRPESTPLAAAALSLVDGGVDPAQLVTRFAAIGATIDHARAAALLDELDRLGLTRRTPGSTSGDRRRMTPMGERLLARSFDGSDDQAGLLAEVELVRTDLVSTIAHELRTPITAIRTSVGLLLDATVEPSPEERQMLLETIDRNATRQQRVVGDIVDLTRFRAGRVRLQLRRFDAVELARSAIASVRLLAESREQVIELAATTPPLWVFGDPRRLEQALVNLLSNATKYSLDGAPIDVSVERAGPDVAWTVVDHGHGIAPEDMERLFERFFVAARDRSETTGGIGLGLPISLMIAQAHDGRIDVDSHVGDGSRFTLIVPVRGPAEVPEE